MLALLLFVVLTTAWAPETLAAQPCPPSDAANTILSQQNEDAMNDANQAASSIANPPQATPWYRITITGEVSSGAPKLALPDFTTLNSNALTYTTNPNHAQAQSDLETALNSYFYVTDQAACSNVAKQLPCHVTTFSQYQTSLGQMGPAMDLNSKLELLSMLGSKLGSLYNANAAFNETPLPTVFQALIKNAQNAGVCRDIHEFLAVTAADLGLKNAGTTTSDWGSGGTTGSHVVAQFQDPQTGKYIFVNYGSVYETNSKYVTEASQQIAEGLNPYTTVTQVETGSGSGNPTLHQMLDPRTQAIQGEINQGSDMSQPHLQIAVGNAQSSVSAQDQLFGNDNDRVGVFALAAEDSEAEPVQVEAAGVRADTSVNHATSRNTAISGQASVKAGFLDVQDEDVPNMTTGTGTADRAQPAAFGSGQAEADFSWKEPHNTGHVGVQVTGQDALYAQGGFNVMENTPYDTINVVAADNPSRGIQLHFTDSGFISSKTAQNINPAYHHVDDAIGAKFTGKLSERISANDDITIHDFNGQAIGIHNATTMSFHTARHGDFSLGTDIAYLKNSSSDDFYNYPLTCSIMAGYQKQMGRFTISASGKYNCNDHDVYTLMQQDSLMSNPGWLLEQPKISADFQISW